jgi:hypothetical protein
MKRSWSPAGNAGFFVSGDDTGQVSVRPAGKAKRSRSCSAEMKIGFAPCTKPKSETSVEEVLAALLRLHAPGFRNAAEPDELSLRVAFAFELRRVLIAEPVARVRAHSGPDLRRRLSPMTSSRHQTRSTCSALELWTQRSSRTDPGDTGSAPR